MIELGICWERQGTEPSKFGGLENVCTGTEKFSVATIGTT